MAAFPCIAEDKQNIQKKALINTALGLLTSVFSNYELTSISLYFGSDFFACRSLFNRSSSETFLCTSWKKDSKSLSFLRRVSLSSSSSPRSGNCSSMSQVSGSSSLTFFVERHLNRRHFCVLVSGHGIVFVLKYFLTVLTSDLLSSGQD